MFRPLVERVLGKGRRFTPHGLRHTFASLHMARGTNLKWIQAQGGWASAKVLLDTYGHYLPSESTGMRTPSPTHPDGPSVKRRPGQQRLRPLRRVHASRQVKAKRAHAVPPRRAGGRAPARTGDPLLVRQVL